MNNFSVGPSQLLPGIPDFLYSKLKTGEAIVSHRSSKFSDFSKNSLDLLRDFWEIADNYRVFYTTSSTECWDIVGRGCVAKSSLHVTNGNFGEHWLSIFGKIGIKTEESTYGNWKKKVDLGDLNIGPHIDLVALTANETSTGIAYSPEDIRRFRDQHSNPLLAIDITSSIGAVAYDFNQADVWHFSIQKGLGLPPGLGVLVLGPRAWDSYTKLKVKKKDQGAHHSLGALESKIKDKYQTPATPNSLGILSLGEGHRYLREHFNTAKELEAHITKRAEKIVATIRQKSGVKLVSDTSICTFVLEGSENTMAKLNDHFCIHNITVSPGYGKTKKTQIRIANYPATTDIEWDNLINVITSFDVRS